VVQLVIASSSRFHFSVSTFRNVRCRMPWILPLDSLHDSDSTHSFIELHAYSSYTHPDACACTWCRSQTSWIRHPRLSSRVSCFAPPSFFRSCPFIQAGFLPLTKGLSRSAVTAASPGRSK
jgi:hypothetical protein